MPRRESLSAARAAGAGLGADMRGAGGGGACFLRKSATPITPTWSGLPVRAAYESDSYVK